LGVRGHAAKANQVLHVTSQTEQSRVDVEKLGSRVTGLVSPRSAAQRQKVESGFGYDAVVQLDDQTAQPPVLRRIRDVQIAPVDRCKAHSRETATSVDVIVILDLITKNRKNTRAVGTSTYVHIIQLGF